MLDFLPEEYEKRLCKAQSLMDQQDMDAMFFTSEAEIMYFTGFRTLFWKSPTRPWYLIVPKGGKPIAIIPSIGENLMQKSWVDDIRIFASPDLSMPELPLLIEALSHYKNIGMPMGEETCLTMSMVKYQLLIKKLSKKFIDCTPIIQKLRVVKSAAEIAIIRDICEIASRAFARAPELFHQGQSLEEVFRKFRIALLQEGADNVEYLVGGADPEGHDNIIAPPCAQKIAEKDILLLDTGSTLKGYYCDFDRNFAFSSAIDEAKNAYDILYQATDVGFHAAKPGASMAEVFVAMNAIIKGDAGQVGRFGHGLGMQLTEFPSFSPLDETIIEENMVLTLEPSIEIMNGKIMVAEENIVITKNGAEYLSKRANDTLPIL